MKRPNIGGILAVNSGYSAGKGSPARQKRQAIKNWRYAAELSRYKCVATAENDVLKTSSAQGDGGIGDGGAKCRS